MPIFDIFGYEVLTGTTDNRPSSGDGRLLAEADYSMVLLRTLLRSQAPFLMQANPTCEGHRWWVAVAASKSAGPGAV
jgi:hypothetical protein